MARWMLGWILHGSWMDFGWILGGFGRPCWPQNPSKIKKNSIENESNKNTEKVRSEGQKGKKWIGGGQREEHKNNQNQLKY